jgi:MFS family permease
LPPVGASPVTAARTVSFRLPRSAWVTLGAQFALNGSTAMVVPFLAVYLSQRLHFSVPITGTALTAYLVSFRVLPAISGSLADRLGRRVIVVLGCLVRAGTLLAFPSLSNPLPVIAAAGLLGVGGALAEPALKAILADQPDETRTSVFAIRNQMLNASYMAGAGLGGVLAAANLAAPFYLGGTALALLGLAFLITGPPDRAPDSRRLLGNYAAALQRLPFVAFWAAMAPWWILYAQLNVALPIHGFMLSRSERVVGLIFIVSGLTGVLAMLPVTRFYRTHSTWTALQVGMAMAGFSFAIIPLSRSYLWFLLCVVLFTLAESLVLVGSDLAVANYAGRETSATFFGLYAASGSVGGSIGNYLGGWLTSSGIEGRMPWLPWTILCLVGLTGLAAVRLHAALFRAVAPDH